MALFKKLFKGQRAAPAPAQPETYNDYKIFPEPAKEPGGFRIGARIEKQIAGETRSHLMIRADTYGAKDTAVEASLAKARQLIDQQGDRIFG